MTAKRKRREIQTGGPSLGPFDKIGHIGIAEIDRSNRAHKRGCLRGREPQLGRPDLGHLPGRPQAGQRQRRVSPGHQHELDSGREV